MKGNPLVFHGISNAKYDCLFLTDVYLFQVKLNEPV